MALKRNMTRDEIIGFINNELLHQAKTEIQAWIWPPVYPTLQVV
jgi:hypothetical protein